MKITEIPNFTSMSPDLCHSMNVLQSNPKVFVPLLLGVFHDCMRWMIKYKPRRIANCRVDSDWDELKIPITNFFEIIDENAIKIITKYELSDISQMPLKKFGCLCNTFIMKKSEYRAIQDFQYENMGIHWRSHYRESDIYCDVDFVNKCRQIQSEIYNFEYPQHFS